jgi:galactose mutarotase-like enzyme
MSGLVAISSDELTARINPLGAELWSLTDRQGREYMTDADPAFWTGHAPLLFPIVGRLHEDALRLGDRAYRVEKHGFARRMEWELVGAGEDAVTFHLADTDATRASYPFAFDLAVLFELEGNTLSVIARIGNPGKEPLPFSFGFHPAFAWPLPGGGAKQAHRIVFERPEPEPVRRIDPASALLLPQAEPTPVIGDTLAPRPELFEADALIWDRLASRSLTFASPDGAALEIAFPDCPHLGVWQKPGAPFLAIEPWHGFNDPVGFTGDFRDKPGIVLLAPGAERRFRLDVTVRNPPA